MNPIFFVGLLIVLAFPVLEIWVTVSAVHYFGAGLSFAWWLASTVLAMHLLRTQGSALRAQLLLLQNGQRHPLLVVLWMARRTFAALLLLLPGFLSDIFALLLLLPWPMPATLRNGAGMSGFAGARPPDAPGETIIDGEFRTVDEPVVAIEHQAKDKPESR